MKYERFEQLPVWQSAIDLAAKVYALTDHRAFARLREFKDQIRRAALSVSNNVAEGFERGTTAELLSFLYIARGSAGEVRSMLLFCRRLSLPPSQISNLRSEIPAPPPQISNLRSEIPGLESQIAQLVALAESCSRQLRAWADQLQNCDIPGQRRLTDKTRRAHQAAKSADAFWQHLRGIRDAAGPPGLPKEDST